MKAATIILSSIAAFLLVALCIVFMAKRFAPPPAQAQPTPEPTSAVPHFDPSDYEQTNAWLIHITSPVIDAIKSRNDIRLAKAIRSLKGRLANEARSTEVRWELPVYMVHKDEVWFREEIPSNKDDVTAHREITLAIEAYPGEEDTSVNLYKGLKVGPSISFDEAAQLDQDSSVIVAGRLESLVLYSHNDFPAQISYRALISNARVVGIGRQKQKN